MLIAYKMYLKKGDQPNEHNIRIIVGILAFDLLTFFLDLIMVLRRWKFVIALRYIMCSVSLSLSVVLSVNFYLFSEIISLNDFSNKWIYVVNIYIYQNIIIWVIINLFMYCQILKYEQELKSSQKLNKIPNWN